MLSIEWSGGFAARGTFTDRGNRIDFRLKCDDSVRRSSVARRGRPVWRCIAELMTQKLSVWLVPRGCDLAMDGTLDAWQQELLYECLWSDESSDDWEPPYEETTDGAEDPADADEDEEPQPRCPHFAKYLLMLPDEWLERICRGGGAGLLPRQMDFLWDSLDVRGRPDLIEFARELGFDGAPNPLARLVEEFQERDKKYDAAIAALPAAPPDNRTYTFTSGMARAIAATRDYQTGRCRFRWFQSLS